MRLRATILVTVALCALTPVAEAQGAVSVRLSGLQDGAVVGGTMPLAVEASATAGIRRLTMWIDGEVVVDQTPEGVKQNVDADYDWDTTRYVSSRQLARNRKYVVKVRAVANGGGTDEINSTAVVNNTPATPSGMLTNGSGGTVSLRWEQNPEPDILGYRVERYYGNDYKKVAFVEEAEFVEKRSPGRYSYRVVALRHSEVAPSGIESQPSEPVTVSVVALGRGSAGGAGGARGSGSGGGGGGRGPRGFVGASGLPGGASLPNAPGLSGLPEAPAPEWGTYKKQLPYKLPRGGIPIRASAAAASEGPLRIIPPDGLRWVAAGLLLLAVAGLARLLALRIGPHPEPAKIEA